MAPRGRIRGLRELRAAVRHARLMRATPGVEANIIWEGSPADIALGSSARRASAKRVKERGRILEMCEQQRGLCQFAERGRN